MTESVAARRAQLRTRLRAGQESTAMVALARAVLDMVEPGVSCTERQAELPALVQHELAGISTRDSAELMLRRHVVACPRCLPLYVELLETGLAQMRRSAPSQPPARKPNLTFLD